MPPWPSPPPSPTRAATRRPLAALGDWNGDDDDEMARVAVLRAYILFWGLGRPEDADDILVPAEAAIPDASNRTWVAAIRADMWTFRGRPTEAAGYIEPLAATGWPLASSPGREPDGAGARLGLVGTGRRRHRGGRVVPRTHSPGSR